MTTFIHCTLNFFVVYMTIFLQHLLASFNQTLVTNTWLVSLLKRLKVKQLVYQVEIHNHAEIMAIWCGFVPEQCAGVLKLDSERVSKPKQMV